MQTHSSDLKQAAIHSKRLRTVTLAIHMSVDPSIRHPETGDKQDFAYKRTASFLSSVLWSSGANTLRKPLIIRHIEGIHCPQSVR